MRYVSPNLGFSLLINLFSFKLYRIYISFWNGLITGLIDPELMRLSLGVIKALFVDTFGSEGASAQVNKA